MSGQKAIVRCRCFICSSFIIVNPKSIFIALLDTAAVFIHRNIQCRFAIWKTGYKCISPEELKRLQENGVLFDIIIDCSGFGPAIEGALPLLDFGGTLCIFGVSPPHVTIKVSPFEVFSKEASIVGVKINCYSFQKALALLESLGDRYLNYDSLGIKTFSIRDHGLAVDSLKRGIIAKAVFKF